VSLPASPPVLIAGAGIGGLTAALALARAGFSVVILEAAERLEEVGAGIQLSPNASRILLALGLGKYIAPHVVAPNELRVMNAHSGRVLARAPLGALIEKRYGAPYWVIHRGDLQAALLAAIEATPAITLRLGARVEDFTVHAHGIAVSGASAKQRFEEHGLALIGADGLWSRLRERLGHRERPRFAGHTAWRTLVPAEAVDAAVRDPAVNLWLGEHAHLVHYPVKGGRLINVVAIMPDNWRDTDWSAPGDSDELRTRLRLDKWQTMARTLIDAAASWQKWALHDLAPLEKWGQGPVTLLGDAAHPMLPYLAQGAAMAIEDAAVLAQCLARGPDDPASALRAYEDARRVRTARTQRAARRNGGVYHMGLVGGALRNLAILAMGGRGLIRRYDWLYGWES
jgi:salicylate hydroxylase